MPLIESQTFRDETVHLDGNTYRNCDIQRCRIVYSGGQGFTLDGCVIAHNNFFLEGAALRTMQTLAFMHRIPELRPIVQGWFADVQRGPQQPPQVTPTAH